MVCTAALGPQQAGAGFFRAVLPRSPKGFRSLEVKRRFAAHSYRLLRLQGIAFRQISVCLANLGLMSRRFQQRSGGPGL